MRLTTVIKFFLVVLLTTLSVDAYCQYNWRRPNAQAFPTVRQYNNKGWIFGLNLNGTFGMESTTLSYTDNAGEVQTGVYTPQSYMGGGIEVGQYRIFRQPKLGFKYLDFSLGYRLDRWGESVSWSPEPHRGNNLLDEQKLYANFNLNWSLTTGRYAFIDIAPGLELAYTTKSDSSYYFQDPYPVGGAVSPNKIGAQFYFKIGYGYMWETDRAIIWSLEIPVLNYMNGSFSVNEVQAWHSNYNKLSMKIQVFLFRVGRGSIPHIGH